MNGKENVVKVCSLSYVEAKNTWLEWRMVITRGLEDAREGEKNDIRF
jgi:hypothetical protein